MSHPNHNTLKIERKLKSFIAFEQNNNKISIQLYIFMDFYILSKIYFSCDLKDTLFLFSILICGTPAN